MKEQNKSINAQSFINDILTPLNNDCQKDPPPDDLKWTIHFDNSRTHTSKKVADFLGSSYFEKLPHPSYSPDLSPLDFAILGTIKKKKIGILCESEEELLDEINKSMHKAKE